MLELPIEIAPKPPLWILLPTTHPSIDRDQKMSRKLLTRLYNDCIYLQTITDLIYLRTTDQLDWQYYKIGALKIICISISYTVSREYRVVRNRISRCYSLVKIAFSTIFTKTIDEYNVTMPVPRLRVASQINSGHATMLSQERPSLATIAKW